MRYPRSVERLIRDELLASFPAVFVVGPRGCGKSTSTGVFAGTLVDLSVQGQRFAVREDPDGALARIGGGVVVIDEWQEEPAVLGAVKRAVDADRSGSANRFIVTGSVRAARMAATWPGTGRLIRVRMLGLTQAEIGFDDAYNPVDLFFGNEPPAFTHSSSSRSDYLDRVVAGRFPATIGFSESERDRWFASYLEQLVERDARQVADGRPRSGTIRTVLRSCVARTGLELNKRATAADADVAQATADSHIALLEDLSVIVRVPAWHSTQLRRVTRSPKLHVIDPGLAAHVMNVDADRLGSTPESAGQLFETFVAMEVLSHVETAAVRTELYHFRTRDGNEVDLVLERRGRVVGLEVKSATSVRASDAKGLRWLRDKLGADFRYGAVLYTGTIPYQLDDRIWALPISTLWTPGPDPSNFPTRTRHHGRHARDVRTARRGGRDRDP